MKLALPASLPGQILAPFYEFLFVPVCCHCGCRLEWGQRFLCSPCWGRMKRALPSEFSSREARARRLEESGVAEALSLYRFETDQPIQSLIHEMKYGGKPAVGILLGEQLGEALKSREGREKLAIPVPLHRRRLRERGYNQSACLCQGIRSVLGIPVLTSVLRRVRYTPTQTALSPEERNQNVAAAFAVPRGQRCANALLRSDIRARRKLSFVLSGSSPERCWNFHGWRRSQPELP
jgi:predicted amidophosphoribosyltransferase